MVSQPAKYVAVDDAPALELLRQFRPSAWCNSWAKRALDVLISVIVLICVLPLFPVIALLIKLTSRGPVFFIHTRIGRDGKTFQMMKFRSMEYTGSPGGIALTRLGDQRITKLGSYLRKWKLDELPQFLNVIRGDMSLIGPRPHMPRLLDNNPLVELFLSLRPGVTGLATMLFRHEESELPSLPGAELESYYIAHILPQKINLELQYARSASLRSDIIILLRTGQQILFGRRGDEAAVGTLRKILARSLKSKYEELVRPGFSRNYVLSWLCCLLVFAIFTLFNNDVPGRILHASSPAAGPRQSASVTGSRSASNRLIGKIWSTISANTQTGDLKTAGDPSVRVWADLETGMYFCQGNDLYGRTRKGKVLTQREAELEHFESAIRQPCK